VPRPIHYCKDDKVIGTEFYIMEYVEGRIFMENQCYEISPDEKREAYK